MVESLATIMSHFIGEANQAWCLAHIVNLVAKIILCQFDNSKKKKKANKPENDDLEDMLLFVLFHISLSFRLYLVSLLCCMHKHLSLFTRTRI